MLKNLKDFEENVEIAPKTRKNDIEELQREADEAGVPRNQHNAKAAQTIAHEIPRALADFTKKADLEPVLLTVPEKWTALSAFQRSAKAAINNLRGQVPGIKEQQKLISRRDKVVNLRTDLENAKKELEEIQKGILVLDKVHGGKSEVEAQIDKVKRTIEEQKTRLRETDRRLALIIEAIGFLEAEMKKEDASDLCPVCGNEAPDLLQQLRKQCEGKRSRTP